MKIDCELFQRLLSTASGAVGVLLSDADIFREAGSHRCADNAAKAANELRGVISAAQSHLADLRRADAEAAFSRERTRFDASIRRIKKGRRA